MLLDMTVDAPAKSLWMVIKQFNGYSGCPCCEEEGEQFVIGKGKKNRNRACHINPFNKANAHTTGHGRSRDNETMKMQALDAMKQKAEGARKVVGFN